MDTVCNRLSGRLFCLFPLPDYSREKGCLRVFFSQYASLKIVGFIFAIELAIEGLVWQVHFFQYTGRGMVTYLLMG